MYYVSMVVTHWQGGRISIKDCRLCVVTASRNYARTVMIMPHSHGHTAVQSLITLMRTCWIWAWTLETFWTFIIQFYSLLTVGWLVAGARRHIKLIRWPSCRQLKQSLNIIELLPSSHEKCFQRAAESRHNIYSYLHCIVYFPQVTSLEWINSMAINNAANIHIENTNSSLHYKQYITLHYITNITSYWPAWQLRCWAAGARLRSPPSRGSGRSTPTPGTWPQWTSGCRGQG